MAMGAKAEMELAARAGAADARALAKPIATYVRDHGRGDRGELRRRLNDLQNTLCDEIRMLGELGASEAAVLAYSASAREAMTSTVRRAFRKLDRGSRTGG